MTTRTTTIEENATSARALIGTTLATLALLGGVLLWQGRPRGEAATPAASTAIGAAREGVAPSGGRAEQYRWAGRGVTAEAEPPAGVPALTDGSGRYSTAQAMAAPALTTGGMAELHRDQTEAAARAVSRCTLNAEPTAC